MIRRALFAVVAVVAVALPSPPSHASTRAHHAPEPATASGTTWQDLARPSPLGADEEASPMGETLARRFNPAMAFVTRDVWPVDISYAWHDGSDLHARAIGENGQTVRAWIARTNAELARGDWGDLSDRDPDANRIEYSVDAPGDDHVQAGVSGWVRRWRAVMGGDAPAPTNAPYPPTQYAHLFWFDRARGLLAVQYWFYFPYNEWINHHEGDWEHITVILRGPTRLTDAASFRAVGYQFFFHTFTHEPPRVVRVGGSDPREDHVVVYTGGVSRFLAWSGTQSGGSYPLPAFFPGAGGAIGNLKVPDDTSRPARFIAPQDFRLVMLPEPERLDVGARPDLAWLRLAFFPGQDHMFHNPLGLNRLMWGGPPRQPARQESWNATWNEPAWPGVAIMDPKAQALPQNWTALLDRAATDPAAAREPAYARRPLRAAKKGR